MTLRHLSGLFLFTLACGGPPISNKLDLSRALAHASSPTTQANGPSGVYASGALPQGGLSLAGTQSGQVVLSTDPALIALGLVGKGLLLDVAFKNYSDDGVYRFDGDLSVLADFQYVPSGTEDPTADFKLSAVGQVHLSGAFTDDLHANVTLIAKVRDLAFRSDSIAMRLNGTIQTNEQRFDFNQEDVAVAWKGTGH